MEGKALKVAVVVIVNYADSERIWHPMVTEKQLFYFRSGDINTTAEMVLSSALDNKKWKSKQDKVKTKGVELACNLVDLMYTLFT
jgi:hypothetical protein